VFQVRYSTERLSSHEFEPDVLTWYLWSWTHMYTYQWCNEVILNLHSYSLIVYKSIVIRRNIVIFFIETKNTVKGKQVSYTFVGAFHIAERQLQASKLCNICTGLVGFCSWKVVVH